MVRLLTDAPRVHRCWLRRRINTAVRRGERTVICSAVCVANRSLRSPLHDGGSRTSPTWYPHLRRWNRCYWVDSQLTSKCALSVKNSVDARSQGEPELLNDRPACSAVPEPGSVTRGSARTAPVRPPTHGSSGTATSFDCAGSPAGSSGKRACPGSWQTKKTPWWVPSPALAPDCAEAGPGRRRPPRAFAAASPYHEMPHVETWPARAARQTRWRPARGRGRSAGAKPDWPLSTSCS